MALQPEDRNLALYCDFENIALGVRDAKYRKFNIQHVLERLLVKGSIVVKKAYCDWDRYKEFKGPMHEAAFELIEIPHVRMSGKNSADIRMVVDALDLCYTKLHVDTFVIISGDSDFSPLVSKLRENAKTVIGVGVKNSTSDLLISNCDEFIYYDDLVRELERQRTPPRPEGDPSSRGRGGRKRSGRSGRSRGANGDVAPEETGATVVADAASRPAPDDAPVSRAPAVPESGEDAGTARSARGGRGGRSGRRGGRADAADRGARADRTGEGTEGGPEAAFDVAADASSDIAADAGGARAEAPAAEPVGRPRRSPFSHAHDVGVGDDDDEEFGFGDADGDADDDVNGDAGGGESSARAAASSDVLATGSARAASDGTDHHDVGVGDDDELDEDGVEEDEEDEDDEESGDESSDDERRQEGIDLVYRTASALSSERGGKDKLWGSMIKQTLKRRRPGFNESYYGFDSFSKMLEEAEAQGLFALEADDRSGGYLIREIMA